jgi:NADH:ubiquinone oxidoreductase subunit 6 (subunit J)
LDVLTSVLFYALAALALIGALGVALLQSGSARALAFLLLALGAAGMYAVLAAGFAAVVTLAVLLASGLLLAPLPAVGAVPPARGRLWHQVGGLACAALLAVLAYAAYRGSLFHGNYAAGDFGLFNAAAMGRLLFGRDALATEAAGALLLLALVTGGARWAGWAVTARRRR